MDSTEGACGTRGGFGGMGLLIDIVSYRAFTTTSPPGYSPLRLYSVATT